MNTQKINELAAKAMGWHEEMNDYHPHHAKVWNWVSSKGRTGFYSRAELGYGVCIGDVLFIPRKWNPVWVSDDALTLIEAICKPNGWDLMRISHEWSDQTEAYKARGTRDKSDDKIGKAATAPLAMTLCALRAAGLPESEINAAMKEGA